MSRLRISFATATLFLALGTLGACQMSNSGGAPAPGKGADHPHVVEAAPDTLKAPATGKASCKLDLVSGAAAQPSMTIHKGAGAGFEGWAHAGDKTFSSLSLLLSGNGGVFAVDVDTGVQREDVAQGFHNDALLHAGFSVTADIGKLAPGAYALSMRSIDKDNDAGCDLGTVLNIAD